MAGYVGSKGRDDRASGTPNPYRDRGPSSAMRIAPPTGYWGQMGRLEEGSAEARGALEEAKAGRGMGELQLKRGLGSAAMQQAAMASSGGPMAQRAAMMAGAQQASQGVGQAAMVRQQEMAAARAGLQGALGAEAQGGLEMTRMELARNIAQAQHSAQMSAEDRLQAEADRKFGIGIAKTVIGAVGAAAASDPKLKGAYSPAGAKRSSGGGEAKGQPVTDGEIDESLISLGYRPIQITDQGARDAELRGQAQLASQSGLDRTRRLTSEAEESRARESVREPKKDPEREGGPTYIPRDQAAHWNRPIEPGHAVPLGPERGRPHAVYEGGKVALTDDAIRQGVTPRDVAYVDKERGFAYLEPGTLPGSPFYSGPVTRSGGAKGMLDRVAGKKSGQMESESARSSAEWEDNPYYVSVTGEALGGAMSDPKLKKGRKKSAKRAQAHPEGSYFIEGAESQGFEPRFMLGTAKESGLGPDERYLSRRNFPSHRRASASWLQPTDRRMAQALEADRTMEDLDTYHYEYKPEYQKRLGLPAGHRIGVMADELEDTPLGEAAVRDTEEGKVIDRDNYMFGVITPGLQRLHERLESLEKKKKGKK